MTDIELYREVGKWTQHYHRRDWFYTGLLGDFHHDVWERIRGRQVNVSYIKQRVYHYPKNAIRNLYYKRTRDFSQREVVLLNEEGGYVEFAADVIPSWDFPEPKKATKYRSNPVIATYLDGSTERFESPRALADTLGIGVQQIYRLIKTPQSGRFRGKASAHIKFIKYEGRE